MFKIYLFAVLSFLFAVNASAVDKQISAAEIQKIEQAISTEGSSFAIVGLAKPASAATLSESVMKLGKSTFLNSVSIANSKRNNSIEIIDKLVNLPLCCSKSEHHWWTQGIAVPHTGQNNRS